MSILSDEVLDSLICTQCKKYLSVKPVKVYQDKGIKCGRCSSPSDEGVNYLHGVLAEDVLFKCVNRFDGCNQLLAYVNVVEHEKICNATRKYECPVCTNPFEGTGYEVLIHFKENHPDRVLIGQAKFVLNIDYEENRTYLNRKNNLLFFINSSYNKNDKELTLHVKYLGASQDAAIILQKFTLLSLDEKVVYSTKEKACSSEETLQYFKIALTEESFPKHVVLCKLELLTGPVEKTWVLPNITSYQELQIEQLNLQFSTQEKTIHELSKEIEIKDREICELRKDRDYFGRMYREVNEKRENEQTKYEMMIKELKELKDQMDKTVPEQLKAFNGKIGEEVSRGIWNCKYLASFPFNIDGRHYFYGQSIPDGCWSIREILTSGRMGEETWNGHWNNTYSMVFPFIIDGRRFFFGHSTEMKLWFIQELLPYGRMGKETHHGRWNNRYKVSFPFTIYGKNYFLCHSLYYPHRWFIQELLPGGRLGKNETSWGEWERNYEVIFPYSINGKLFMYRHSTEGLHWFIDELLPGGKIGEQWSRGCLKKRYTVSFPFKSNGRQYFYSQSVLDGKDWFIRELLPNGQMGQETDSGSWDKNYETVFPFSMEGKHFFYGCSNQDNSWFIKLLL